MHAVFITWNKPIGWTPTGYMVYVRSTTYTADGYLEGTVGVVGARFQLPTGKYNVYVFAVDSNGNASKFVSKDFIVVP